MVLSPGGHKLYTAHPAVAPTIVVFVDGDPEVLAVFARRARLQGIDPGTLCALPVVELGNLRQLTRSGANLDGDSLWRE